MTKLSLVLAAALCACTASFGQGFGIIGPGDAPTQVLNHPGGPATQFLTANPTWQALNNQPGALLFTDTKAKKGALLGNVTHQDSTSGVWVQNDASLSATANGWRLDGTANQVLIQKSGTSKHVVTQTYTDYATKHNSVLAVTLPTLTYSKGFRLTFTQGGLPWTLLFNQSGAFRLETTVAKKQGAASYSFPVTSSEPLTIDSAGELFGNAYAGLTRAVMIPRFGKAIPCSAWSYSKSGIATFTCDDSSLKADQFPYRIDPQSQVTLTDPGTYNISSWQSCDDADGCDSAGGNDAYVTFNFGSYVQSNSTGFSVSAWGCNVDDQSTTDEYGNDDGDTVQWTVEQPYSINNVTVDIGFQTNYWNSNNWTYSDSATVSGVYAQATWTPPPAAAPPSFNGAGSGYQMNVNAGSYIGITDSSPGVTIMYTTDGSTPSHTHGTLYTGPFQINQPETIYADAFSGSLGDSISVAWFALYLPSPSFGPSTTPIYCDAPNVTISVPSAYVPAGTIYYTTDGSAPGAPNGLGGYTGNVYNLNSPPSVPTNGPNATTTIRAAFVATAGGYISSVSSATYTVTGYVANPAFSEPAGIYSSGQSISLSDSSPGTTIMYTTDGSTPTLSHGTAYSSTPISFLNNTTINAAAFKTNWCSTSSSATYTIVYPGAPITGSQSGIYTNGTPPTPAADSGNGLDPRRTGVRALSAYWGASGENIDTVSGNLNFSTPLIKPISRGNWSVTFMLSYNSQMWRRDSAGTWALGQDVGYGLGWKFQAGSITPIWSGTRQFSHYIYTDATGAEYNLSVSNNNVWTSTEGTYVSYDEQANKLYFTDGSFWYMGCQSASGELDMGTLYPTLIEDTNGNQIQIYYQAGSGAGSINSSSRISQIQAPNATYNFTYTNSHMAAITSGGPGEFWQLTYNNSASLQDPFVQASYPTASLLTGVQSYVNSSYSLPASAYSYNASGELTGYTTAMGGSLSWGYTTFSYNGGIEMREVYTRGMNDPVTSLTNSWALSHPSGDSGLTYHSATTVLDSGAASQKVYGNGTTSSGNIVVPTSYTEQNAGGTVTLLQKGFVWTQDAAGTPYVGTLTSTLNPNTSPLTTQTVQTLDSYGNLTQQVLYDYSTSSNPSSTNSPYSTYTFSYLSSSAYTSLHIRNRLTAANVTHWYGPAVSLASIGYDGGTLQDPGSVIYHDSNYGLSQTTRGNPTSINKMGTITNYSYLVTGVPYQMSDGDGMVVSLATDSSTNFSLPTVLTPNSNGNLATTMTYSWFSVNSVTGPNGATQSMVSDLLNRPEQSTSVDGAVTNYSYTYRPSSTGNTQTATISTTSNGTTTTQWKTTTFDGFGRTIRVQIGHDGVAVTNVDTQYAPCGCSPLGKMTATSMPYPAGNTPNWTTNTYDTSGRIVTQTKPDGSATTTAYTTSGFNETKVTDPAGNWKSYRYDANGGLIAVSDPPNPNSITAGRVTYYLLNGAGQILQVWVEVTPIQGGVVQQVATQPRNYTWSGTDLISATDPETGTTTYAYDNNHHVKSRVDAKGQLTTYTYDSYERLTEVQHYTCDILASQLNCGNNTEQVNQRVYYTYDVNPLDPGNYVNSWGRLTGVNFTQEVGSNYQVNPYQFGYYYSYNQAGRVTANSLLALDGTNVLVNLQATYAWDNQGRMTNMNYPSGTQLAYSYDSMGRLSGINSQSGSPSGVTVSAGYNAASQLTSLSYGGYGPVVGSPYNGTTTFTETRSYNSLMQLYQLANNMNLNGSNSTVVNMEYDYNAGQNNGRVAQIKDFVLGETVNYTYDAWNRLSSAGATNGNWGESYTFDGFGNLTDKTPTVGSAPPLHMPVNMANNQTTYYTSFDANGNAQVNNNWVPAGPGYVWDIENRLVADQSAVYTPIDYSYDPWGRRIWKQINNDSAQTQTAEVYFYGATGQKLETYSLNWGVNFPLNLEGINIYFGGKLLQSKGAWVATDRLGSVRANSNLQASSYWPYGEERSSGSVPNGGEKFATYTRDSATQDYAEQRYYNANMGAFWSPDRDGITIARPSNPTTWNRYARTNGDPVNFGDASGRIAVSCSDPAAQSIYDASCEMVGDGSDGGGNNCGGGEFDSTPDPSCYAYLPPPPEPTDPSCTLAFEYRALSGNPYLYVGTLGYAAHAYLDFTTADGSSVITEGTGHNGNVVVQETDSGLPNDHPGSDHVAGSITSPQVCDWLSTLTDSAIQINEDNVPYHWYGPNSSTVLYYLLSQLPSSSWWSTPPGLLGFHSYPF